MRLTVAILAGGRSRRMGFDKSRIRIAGHESLLARQVAVARRLGPVEIVLSCRPDQFPQTPTGVRPAFDDGTCGPLAGLVTSLGAAHGDAVLLLAVDLPGIRPHLLKQIIAATPTNGSTGVLPVTPAGIEPLAGVYPKRALPVAITQLRAAETYSMRSLAKTLHEQDIVRWFKVPVWEAHQFTNLNRPTDLADINTRG